MCDLTLKVCDSTLDDRGNIRIHADLDGTSFYIRAVKYFWSIMFRHQLRFKFTPINSVNKGPSLLITEIFDRDSYVCNVSSRALMLHRANRSGECVVTQSAGCLIPINRMIDLQAQRVVGESDLKLVQAQVRKLERARVTCEFYDFLARPEPTDWRKTLRTGEL